MPNVYISMRFMFALTSFLHSAEALPHLPHPLERYLRSTPFLPVAHLIDTLALPAGAYSSGIRPLIAVEAFCSFLDGRSGNALARKRLFCSAFWTTALLIHNAERVSTFPWYRFGSVAERLIFIINILAALVMIAQLFAKVSVRDPRKRVETERVLALVWFYDSSSDSVEKWRNGALGFAIVLHCCICIAAVLSLILSIMLSKSRIEDIEVCFSKAVTTLLVVTSAFAVSILMAILSLQTFELLAHKSKFPAGTLLDPGIHSVIYASVLYEVLIRKSVTPRFNWWIWVVSDGLLWAVGEQWEKYQETRAWDDIAVTLKGRRKNLSLEDA